jgi:hypothetical protein
LVFNFLICFILSKPFIAPPRELNFLKRFDTCRPSPSQDVTPDVSEYYDGSVTIEVSLLR